MTAAPSACARRAVSSPNVRAAADHDDGLPHEFRFSSDWRGDGCGIHDSSDQGE